MKTNFRALGALMLGLSLGGGLLTTAHAAPANGNPQARPERGKRGEGKGMKLMDELNLTDAQKQQLKPILQSAHEQTKALRQNTTLSQADKKAQLKALHQDTKAKVNAILTPDQQKKLAQLKAEHKAERGDKDNRKRGQNRQPLPPVPAP